MKIILLLVTLLLAATTAQAQTVQVDINRAKLSWDWTPDDVLGSLPTEFRTKCGTSSGSYTKITSIGATAREMPIKDAITGPGNWFCIVAAANAFGESGGSNEVGFDAGAAPAGKLDLILMSK